MDREVVTTPRLEEAAAKLAAAVREARAARGPLVPTVVWTPSRSVGAYLKLAVANALGVAANIETSTIVQGIEGLAGSRHRRLDRYLLRGRLLALLFDPRTLEAPSMAPVVRWLGGGDPERVDRRKSELAARLGSLFESYLLGRPRWLAGAPRGGSWQLELLDRAREGSGALDLAQLVDAIPDGALPRTIHVIGWSVMPYAAATALERLATRTELRIYAPNPSRAFWADPSTPIEDLVDDSLLLSRVGPALRELMHRHTGEGDVVPERATRSLLDHLQACLEAGRDRPFERSPDGTVRVWACPGIRREVEVVAQEIWRRMAADPTLKLDEIAVYYVDRDDQPYAPHVRAVFEEAHQIPHRIAPAPLAGESSVVSLLVRLLELPLGSRTRPEVLGVLTDPLVAGAWRDASTDDWLAWADAAGIVRGADGGELAATYVEGKPLYHWDQGLRRIALGTLMGGPSARRIPPLDGETEPVFPVAVGGSDAESAGRLILLARSLLADAGWARTARLPLGDWIGFIGTLITTYVTPRDEADTRALRACLGAIAKARRVEAGDAPLPYRVARDLAVEALEGLISPSGAELVGRVHVAPLSVGTVVPFRHVFVLGLNGTAFPSSMGHGDLDLRPRSLTSPNAEDVAELLLDASAEDRDRAAFIEVLWSARESLVLSWDARDALTGEAKAASSLVSDVVRWVSKVTGQKLEPETVKLWRHEAEADDVIGQLALPSVARETRAHALGQVAGRSLHSLRTRIEVADALSQQALRSLVGLVELGSAPAPQQSAPARVVRIGQLRKFLECPLQGSAAFAEGLRGDEDEDALGLTEEPLASPMKTRGKSLRDLFADLACSEGTLDAAIARMPELQRASWERRIARAVAPASLMAEVEQQRERDAAALWIKQLTSRVKDVRQRRWTQVVVGAPEDPLRPGLILPPIRLTTKHGDVELIGCTELVSIEAVPRLSVFAAFPRSRPNEWDKLRGLLDHLVLTVALGEACPLESVLIAVPRKLDKPQSGVTKLCEMEVADARAYLADLVEDLLDGPFDFLFPFVAAEQVLTEDKPVAGEVEKARDAIESDFRPSWSYGPVRNPERREAPSEEEGLRMAKRRFDRFFMLATQPSRRGRK